MNAFRLPSARRLLRLGLALCLGLAALRPVAAQGTAFGYQGQLTDGPTAANGVYDLRFTLWNAASSGQQQGPVVDAPALSLTNGLFQATLDFGARFDGTDRWLEIAIRTNGAATFETLPTRQPVTPTPYAIHAATATTAAALSGTVAASQVTGLLSAAQVPDLDASKISGGTLAASLLPGLDANQIQTGTLSDARLGSNIPRLDNNPAFVSDLRLSDNDLFLRGGSDTNHGLGWFGGPSRLFAGLDVDGPVLYGRNGGLLGSTLSGQRIALRWDRNGDGFFGGHLTVSNIFTVEVRSDRRAGQFYSQRTGDWQSAVVHVENLLADNNASPALALVGHGASHYGVLNVRADSGRVITAGDSNGWYFSVDVSGNVRGASFTGSFGGSGTGLYDLDASAITIGTLSDSRLSPNIPRLDGNPVLSSDLRLSDNDLFLRGGSDTNHGLGWFGGTSRLFANVAVDGPVLYGFSGGALGSTRFGQTIALRWDQNADSVFGGDVTVTNTLSVTAPSSTRAASLVGSRTGDYRSAVVHIENMSTNSNASPALRINGRGTSNDGALNVSADSGRLARFGNATDWVVAIENAGHIAATSFVTLSDRDKKAGFADVDVAAVLEKVAGLRLQTWHYTNDPSATPHLGPMAQDFHAAFGLGASDRSIATVDADGVALAAIQGLHHRTRELAEALEAEQAENRALRRDLESLRGLVEELGRRVGSARP